MTTALLLLIVGLLFVAIGLLVLARRDLAHQAARTRAGSAATERQLARVVKTVDAMVSHQVATAGRHTEHLERIEDLLASDASLVDKTVVLERSGHDVPNLRGVVIAEHEDRLTLDQAQAVTTDGDVPLEHPVVHVDRLKILSVSEVTS